MREIKFRCWIKEEKIMVTPEQLINLDGNMANDDGKDVLMQFTGLYDKNGKDIYEGDIMQAEVENPCSWLVVWNYNGFYLERYYDDGKKDEGYFGIITDWKVIGNIYDNPELLTNK
jgi:uncharacterized phage protein (TIGR01671 family)